MTPNSTVRSTPQAAPRSPQSSPASAPEGTTRSVQDGVALSSSAVRPNGTSLSESILQAWNVPYDPADVAETLTLRRGLGDESSLPRALDPRHFGTSPRLTPTDEGYDVRGMSGRGTVRVGQDGSIITEGRTPQHDTRSVQTPAEGGGYAEEFRTEYYPGGQRNRPIQQITGGRIEADGSSDVYELNYRADGSLLSTTDEERSGPGDDADFHREHERFDSRGEVVATGHHTRETGSDGVVREREIFDGPNRTVDGHRTILPDGTESGQRTEVNRVANPETE